MRAYRPSNRSGEELDDQAQRERNHKLEVFAERARAGLPLFDDEVEPLAEPTEPEAESPDEPEPEDLEDVDLVEQDVPNTFRRQ